MLNMGEPGGPDAELNKPVTEGQVLRVSISEESKVVKFTETEVEQGWGEEGNGEWLFHGYRVSGLQDENVLENCCTTT